MKEEKWEDGEALGKSEGESGSRGSSRQSRGKHGSQS